ncbi:Magnesium and cobalt efflux protein CorC [hydrothermal vent metagenome]|uniref:Magnesium and cobalt efflux protein CorC n=1 Tax=hydrothermal vent metagenome TaxID=652676 RepID=A0A3B0Z8H7_9ZZZZ
MSEDQSNNGSSSRSWFERISQALLGELQDRKQLLELLRDAEQRNLLDADALTMIERVLQVSELRVRDIMVPRSQMVVVEQQAPLKESVNVITESGHSRFPVIGDGRDDVNGILLAKDLLVYMSGNQDDFNIRDILRPAVFIPESKRLNVLLKEFRANRNHMAIVVDEYSGVSGVITIEDVLEQIVGDIEDEHDIDEDISIKEHGKGQFTVEALTPLNEFNEYFELSLDETEFDTIGGLIVSKFGYLPHTGEQVSLDDLEFKVLRADTRRVQLLQVVHNIKKS